MMEEDQYGLWLSSCLGYWCQPLKAYSKMNFWNSDPKLKPFSSAIGFAVLRWLQGPDQRGIGGGDRQLHCGGHVRLRGVRQRNTPEAAAKQAAKAARALLQEGLIDKVQGVADGRRRRWRS